MSSIENRNRLLASLKKEDLSLLQAHLRVVTIQQGEFLEQRGRPVDSVYFPQTGMISLIVEMPEDASVEVGMVGYEGAIGITAGLGSRLAFVTALVQVSGTCLRISAAHFRLVADRSEHVRGLIVRHTELQMGQIQ
jgi:CRP-like cAMP-binding protein